MANIGSFKKSGNDYQGALHTLSVQQKNVRIVAETDAANENAPTHRVLVGSAEIGAAWAKTSRENREYLSVKLDDPSFAAPIYANLVADDDGKTFNLIWSRPTATAAAEPNAPPRLALPGGARCCSIATRPGGNLSGCTAIWLCLRLDKSKATSFGPQRRKRRVLGAFLGAPRKRRETQFSEFDR